MRIFIAIELEVPDDTDIEGLSDVLVKVDPTFGRLPSEVVRWEIHPDPATIFDG